MGPRSRPEVLNPILSVNVALAVAAAGLLVALAGVCLLAGWPVGVLLVAVGVVVLAFGLLGIDVDRRR